MRHNSASELTKPAKNVQMPQKASKAVWTLTDPYTSPSGPTTKRATTQAATLKTFDIQMPFLAMLRSWRRHFFRACSHGLVQCRILTFFFLTVHRYVLPDTCTALT